MQNENKKKKKGFLIPIIIAGVVALAGLGVGGYFLFGNRGNVKPEPSENTVETEPTDEEPVVDPDQQIFWNVDRLEYDGKSEIGLSSRTPDPDDGYYHIKFATNGRQVVRRCADKALVNLIDKERAMGLQFDENGIITGFTPVAEFTGGYAYDGMYVNGTKEGKVMILNSSAQLDGMDFEVECSPECRVFDVSGTYFDPGTEINFSDMTARDRLVCIKNYDDEIYLIFVTDRYSVDKVYWNINLRYNNSLSVTTREPNEDGLYEFLFAVDGGQQTLYTRSRDVATAIDAVSTHAVGLRFDDEGLIVECYSAVKAAGGGGNFGNWGWVYEINGNQLVAGWPSNGKSNTAVASPELRIFDCSGEFDEIGKEITLSELGLMDQIVGFKDASGQINYIFIAYRHVDPPMYFVFSKQADSATKTTTRKPDANGYYVYEIAVNGELKKFRTNDKALADKIDSGPSFFGAKTDGDIILATYTARSVAGNYAFAGGYNVTKVLGNGRYEATLLAGSSTSVGAKVEFELAEDAKIVNCSTMGNRGGYTTLRVGDRIYPHYNPELKACYVFITQRTVDGGQIYARYNRSWNANTQETTRKPKEDGFYYLSFTRNGKKYDLKTADKSIVNKIDSLGYAYMTLTVNGDVITGAYEPNYCEETPGGISPSYCDVISKSGNTFVAQRNIQDANFGKQYTVKMASNCGVYNIGAEYNEYGEATTVRVGDRITALVDRSGNARYVFIVDRPSATRTAYCPVCGESVVWKSFNGSFAADGNPVIHYYLAGDRTPNFQPNTPADTELHFDMNGKTWTSGEDMRLIALFNENSTAVIFDASGKGGTIKAGNGKPTTTSSLESGPIIWLRYASNGLIIDGVDMDFSAANQDMSQGAIMNPAGSLVVLNDLSIKGGNLYSGAAIYANGVVALNDVTITGGVNETGGSVYVSSTGEIILSGKTSIQGGKLQDGTSANLVLANGKVIHTIESGITSAAESISVRLSKNGTFTDAAFEEFKNAFKSDIDGAVISVNEDGSLAIEYSLTGIEFAEKTVTVQMGSPAELGLRQLPVAIEGTEVVYKSADETKVRVTENGMAVGLKETGEEGVEITATAGEFTATCKVIVTPGEVGEHYHAETVNEKIATDEAKINWTKWSDGTSFPTESGYYYLDTDITLPEATPQIMIGSTAQIHVCLNGHTIAGNMRAFLLYAKGAELSICDCSEGEKGVVKPAAGADTANGRTVYVRQGSVLNLYGGTLIGGDTNNATYGGGAIYVDTGSVFNMYGGTVKDGVQSAARGGGNIYVNPNGTFNMSGGTVSGATAGGNGANIYSGGTFNMSGGTIKDGTSTNTGGNIMIGNGTFEMTGGLVTGGTTTVWPGSENLYVNHSAAEVSLLGGQIDGCALFLGVGSLTIGNDMKIVNEEGTKGLYLRDHSSVSVQNVVIADCGLKEGAEIFVNTTRTAEGLIARNATEADKAFFTCDESHTIELLEDTESKTGYSLYLQEVVIPDHMHCVCGGALAETEGHTCTDEPFTAWRETTSLPTTTGKYYLTEDVTVTAAQTVNSDQHVVLCLNGHTVTTDKTRIYFMAKNSTNNSLTITDCTGVGKMTNTTADNGANGGGIFLCYGGDNSVLNIYGGTIGVTENYKATVQGAVIYQLGKSIVNIYGGTIQGGGTVSATGGTIGVTSSATLNIYGGTIEGCAVTGYGGTILAAGKVNMYGGTVTGGSSDNSGGNIYVSGTGTFKMSGGEIVNGESKTNGGGLASSGTVEISGGSFSGNKAITGGNLLVSGGTFTVTGGTFTPGTVSSLDSGNAFIHSKDAEVTLSGGQFDGAVVVYAIKKLTLGGNVVIANETKTSGLFYGSSASAIPIQEVEIAETGFTEGASIYVVATKDGTNGLIAKNAKESDLPYFSTSAEYEIVLQDDSNSTTGKSVYRVKKAYHEHCVCGGKMEGAEGHTCSDIQFTEWTSTNSLPTTTGNYYLTAPVTLTAAQTVNSDQNIVLCLNGYNVTTTGVRVYYLAKNSTNNSVTITDCVGTATVKQAKADNENNGGGIFLCYGGENSVVNIYGGNYTMNASYTSTANGGMFYLLGQAVLNVYGGTFDGARSEAAGGFASLSSEMAVFNMYGGTVKNAYAPGGGAIYSVGILNLYGGTIENCTANAGGGIFTMGNGRLLIDGVTITGCTAATGGNIYSNNALTLKSGTISGGKQNGDEPSDIVLTKEITVDSAFTTETPVTIARIDAATQQYAAGALTLNAADETLFASPTSDFMIEKKEDGTLVFTALALKAIEVSDTEVRLSNEAPEKEVTVSLTPSNAPYTSVEWTSSDDEIVTVTQDEADPLKAVIAIAKPGETATVTVTIGEFTKTIDVTTAETHDASEHEADSKWKAWTSTTSLPTTTGYYYLTSPVTLKAVQSVGSDQNVFLCLNGYDVTVNTTRMYFLTKNSTNNSVSISDCKGTATVKQNIANNGGNGGGLFLCYGAENSKLNIYGGKFTMNESYTSTGSGGAMQILGKAEVNVYGGTFDGVKTGGLGGFASVGSATAALNIYGGTIKNASATNGGAIHSIGTVNIYGGTIENCSATTSGGSIYALTSGTLNIYDGTITGGTANGAHGGNLYVGKNIVANIYGGEISGGESHFRGGNILVDTGTLNTFEDAVIKDGTALNGSTGGNISTLNTCTVNIAGSTLEGGEAKGSANAHGGSISVHTGSTVSITDGAVITGGKTTGTGGNIYIDKDSSVTINDAEISNGTAYTHGGNIYVDAALSADTTAKGKLSIEKGTLTRGVVDAGEAANTFGGNLYSRGDVTIKDSEISYGEARGTADISGNQGFGGNLYFHAGTATIEDTEITDGTAAFLGGNVYISRISEMENTAAYAYVTMTDCTVTKGSAYIGSGIYIMFATTLIMDNTVVTDNTVTCPAPSTGCAFHLAGADATVILKNVTRITGNKTQGGEDANLFIVTNGKIKVDSLTTGAEIGVLLSTKTGVFTDYCGDVSAYVKSDREGHGVVFADNALSVVETE